MKLATLRNGARDGMLVVVSRDLARYTPADSAPSNRRSNAMRHEPGEARHYGVNVKHDPT